MRLGCCVFFFFFFKQKTAYEILRSDWSSDVCSSDLRGAALWPDGGDHPQLTRHAGGVRSGFRAGAARRAHSGGGGAGLWPRARADRAYPGATPGAAAREGTQGGGASIGGGGMGRATAAARAGAAECRYRPAELLLNAKAPAIDLRRVIWPRRAYSLKRHPVSVRDEVRGTTNLASGSSC